LMTFLLAYLNVNFNFNIFVYGSWICIFYEYIWKGSIPCARLAAGQRTLRMCC